MNPYLPLEKAAYYCCNAVSLDSVFSSAGCLKYKKNRLSKFQYFAGNPNATLDSEEILLETSERSTFTHNGGWLGFKPSDYAYNTVSSKRKCSGSIAHRLFLWVVCGGVPC